ncbi:MAG TPA: type II toxin-antitoxin system VapC family toxin [Verrucomicrobiae bacterium]|nr:type II toxin-antitoxin system VapC family toxin [Verrucomicrobiae bacterium]
MVIDTSALVAIFLNEPDRDHLLEFIVQAEKRLISAAIVVEAGIVLEARRGEAVARELDLFLHGADIEIVSVDHTQAEQARLAFRRYGKGRHPAGLNFGDCFTFALAAVSGEPILAKGEEFRRANLHVLS